MGGWPSTASKPTKWFDDYVTEHVPADLSGKVFVITGTTSGTGFIAANALASRGANLVLLNRQSTRATDSLKKIREAFPEAKLEAVECDLQSFESVKSAAKKVAPDYPQIDSLVLNAGVMALADKATVDGYDVQMQTNHLSQFLLASMLFPNVNAAAEAKGEARIVTHSSVARFGSALEAKYFGPNGGNLGGDGASIFGGARWKRYQQTKMANLVFMYALRDRLQAANSKVKAVCAHPGIATTGLQQTTKKDGGFGGIIAWVSFKLAQSPEDGTMGLIKAAAGKDVQNGDFYGPGSGSMAASGVPQNIPQASKFANKAQTKLLWEESEKAVGEFKIE